MGVPSFMLTPDVQARVFNLESRLDEVERELENLKTRMTRERQGGASHPSRERQDDTAGGDGPPAFVSGLINGMESYVGDWTNGTLIVLGGLQVQHGEITSRWSRVGVSDRYQISAPEAFTRACQPFSSPQRVQILKQLFGSSGKTAGDIRESTGLAGGQLYHHLKDLIHSGLVRQTSRGEYRLTGPGMVTLLSMDLLARLAAKTEYEASDAPGEQGREDSGQEERS